LKDVEHRVNVAWAEYQNKKASLLKESAKAQLEAAERTEHKVQESTKDKINLDLQ